MSQPFFKEHQIKIGRDALFNVLYINHLLVRKRKRKISMTENGNPLKNTVAERVNGIIKESKDLLKAVVNLYNNERPHMSISNLTPIKYINQHKN